MRFEVRTAVWLRTRVLDDVMRCLRLSVFKRYDKCNAFMFEYRTAQNSKLLRQFGY